MINSEELQKIYQEMNNEANQNLLYHYHENFKIVHHDQEILVRIFDIITDFYVQGWKCFRTKEWGFPDANSMNYKDKLAAKPCGDLMQALYNLCKECHSLQGDTKISLPYTNAYRWFVACIVELPFYDLDYMISKNNASQVEIWDERIQCFKDIEYPPDSCEVTGKFKPYHPAYNPYVCGKIVSESQGLLLLVESAYTLAASVPNFDQKYWRPFVESLISIAHTLKNSKNLIDVKITVREQLESNIILEVNQYQTKKRVNGQKFGKPKKFK